MDRFLLFILHSARDSLMNYKPISLECGKNAYSTMPVWGKFTFVLLLTCSGWSRNTCPLLNHLYDTQANPHRLKAPHRKCARSCHVTFLCLPFFVHSNRLFSFFLLLLLSFSFLVLMQGLPIYSFFNPSSQIWFS